MGNAMSMFGFNKPSGGLYMPVDQENITKSEYIKVQLNTIIEGFSDGIEDTVNHKITPGVAGLYLLVGQITYGSLVTNKRYDAIIEVNNIHKVFNISQANVAGALSILVATIAWLGAADYVELFARHDALVNTVDIVGLQAFTFLQVHRIR